MRKGLQVTFLDKESSDSFACEATTVPNSEPAPGCLALFKCYHYKLSILAVFVFGGIPDSGIHFKFKGYQ